MPKISVNTTGGPGRPAGTLNTQTWLRIQRVARMEVVGISDRMICDNENIDHPALKYLRTLPEYQEVKEDLLQGHLTEMDKAMAGRVDILKGQVRQAVPSALRCLIDVVNQRRDLRTALAAASEILDRDPDRGFLKAKDPSVSMEGSSVPDAIMESTSREADSLIPKKETIQ
jgi:hypothetical protein